MVLIIIILCKFLKIKKWDLRHINDISSNGNQPLIKNDNYYLICNGEIYRHKGLQQENEFQTKSNSDCEIIIHMYEKYGIEKTIKSLDGVFFCLYDKSKNKIFIGNDPYGVRPLFLGKTQIMNY